MSVVLRCPTCGTTQAHAGECEACSEGEVRYFCTNHDEAVWLEEPVCGVCGARFGEAPAKRPTSPAPRVPIPPAGAPDFRPPMRRHTPERPRERDFRRAPRPSEREEPEVLPPTPSLGELLEEFAEERVRARARRDVEEAPWAEPPGRRRGFPVAGCLVRVIGLVFLLIAAAIIFLFLLFGRCPVRLDEEVGKPETRLPVLHGCDPDDSGREGAILQRLHFRRGQA